MKNRGNFASILLTWLSLCGCATAKSTAQPKQKVAVVATSKKTATGNYVVSYLVLNNSSDTLGLFVLGTSADSILPIFHDTIPNPVRTNSPKRFRFELKNREETDRIVYMWIAKPIPERSQKPANIIVPGSKADGFSLELLPKPGTSNVDSLYLKAPFQILGSKGSEYGGNVTPLPEKEFAALLPPEPAQDTLTQSPPPAKPSQPAPNPAPAKSH